MYMGDFEERRLQLYGKSTSYEPRGIGYGERSIQGQIKKFNSYKNDSLIVDNRPAKTPARTYYYDRVEQRLYKCVPDIARATGLPRDHIRRSLNSKNKNARFMASKNRADFPAQRKAQTIFDCVSGITYKNTEECSGDVCLSESTVRTHLQKNKELRNIRFYYADSLTDDEKKQLIESYKGKK